MQNKKIELVSSKLCPYVQRSVITLIEKSVEYRRIDINLSDKPTWFIERSPTGKVPLLTIDDEFNIFESAVICEYLDETTGGTLLPSDPKIKAVHRSWIEFASQTLDTIGAYYSANHEDGFNHAKELLVKKFARLNAVVATPYFSGQEFMMVDAAFAPVFRYFEVFEQRMTIDIFDGLNNVNIWRNNLAARKSVQDAVSEDFHQEVIKFVLRKDSYLSMLMKSE
ncbi:MAG: glutathione S-transferase family protein [Gammaproteobacteria bacterium]|nr:glutathione S-transferase family protein [Gammaproteobacteria bacterium]